MSTSTTASEIAKHNLVPAGYYSRLLAILLLFNSLGCDRTGSLKELGSKDPNIKITWSERRVHSLSVNGDKSLQRVLPLLEGSIHVDRIFIQYCNLQSAQLKAISQVRTLIKLEISGGAIPEPKDLGELRKLPNLNVVHLEGCRLSDDVFKYLDGLSNLRELSLNNNNISSITGLTRINTPQLLILTVQTNPIDDDGFRDIVLLPNLEGVDILDTSISMEGCKQAAALWKLRAFSMPNMSISEQREVKAAFDEARRNAQSKAIEILPEKEYPFAYLESGFFKDRKE